MTLAVFAVNMYLIMTILPVSLMKVIPANAYPTDRHEIKFASSSIHQGDLILSDNDVYTINGSFAINGSIIVKDNATLILEDATVNFTQAASNQFNLTLKEPNNGNPKLQTSNATLESTYILRIYLYGNSTVSADNLHAYHEINFFDESSGNITNSPVLWTVNCNDYSNPSFVNSQLVQMRIRDASKVLFSESNATNFIEVYNDSSINTSNSRIRGFGTYGSAQATVNKTTLTYFNDQGSNHLSSVNITHSTITDEFRSWGASQINFSNCTINFSDINSRSIISYEECWINGIHTRFSATVTIRGQCTSNGSIIAEENSTLILDHAILNFTQVADWQLNITLTNPVDGNPRLQCVNTTVTSNFRYSIYLLENSSASIHNSQFIASLGHYCWLFLWDSSHAFLADSTIHGLSSFTSTGFVLLNSSVTDLNVYTPANASIYRSDISTMNTYLNAAVTAEKSSILGAQAFDNSSQFMSDSTINLILSHDETVISLTNSTCGDFTLENESQVFVYWYLDVHVVDSLFNNVPSANVTATFPNATWAQSKLTDLDGWARLTLMEKMMNATGDYYIGNYTLEAKYLSYSNATTTNMTGNQQLVLKLEDFIIPEFPASLLMLLLIVSSLLAFTARAYKTREFHAKGRCLVWYSTPVEISPA